MNARRTTISIPEALVKDMRERLGRTLLPDELANDDWHYGTSKAYMADLVSYWASDYDWRRTEKRINAYENFMVDIDGQPIHFLRKERHGALPLLLLGGWPWTFWDFEEVIPRLNDYAIVVPDLPGYGFSAPLQIPDLGVVGAAARFHTLMTEVLGYSRYGVYGSDWGALIGAQMAHENPGSVVGFHTTMPFPLDLAPIDPGLWAEDEASLAALTNRFWSGGAAYFQMHATRPQTVAYLGDSPAAMGAWLVEKFHGWSHHDGDLEAAYPRNKAVETLSIYWLTRTFGSSVRFYSQAVQNPWRPSRPGEPVVSVPTGVSVFPGEVAQVPRRWMEKYYNLQYYARMERGGHFPAIENPVALARELNTFFSRVQ